MDKIQTHKLNIWLCFFICTAVLVNFSGLFTPIIGPDGTTYAIIAKTMVLRNNYVELFNHGKDWLDKPHFPFWITAIFFKCFGFKTWAYKLPGILFLLMGAAYTYLFAKALYSKQVALWSVMILLTAQHIILSNNDVRAEPYLTGMVIAAVYHFYKADKYKSFWQLLAGCAFTAFAIMTKGPFVIAPIAGAMAGQLIITRQWKALFNIRWLLAIVLTGIFILPEIWCLYRQFDLHPEKVIFGQKGISGIKFFFWDSQFGRFFNNGPIKGSGDPFFFIHTTLWAFLPWSLLLFAAIFQFIKKGIKNVQEYEWYCISAALLTFLLFSASRFQLPHYLNIVFPFFAIITAQYLYNLTSLKSIRAVVTTQNIVAFLLLTMVVLLHYFFRPDTFGWPVLFILLALVLLLVFFPKKVPAIPRVVFITALASFIINLYLNLSFYPSLLHYQAGNEAAIWINKNNPHKLPVAELNDDYASAFEFYGNTPVSTIEADGTGKLPPKPFLLYAPTDVIKSLYAKGWNTQTLNTFDRYWITLLKPSFLNNKTRAAQLTKTEIVLVK